MNPMLARFRYLSFALVLALALVVGQQVVALHGLGHAVNFLHGQEHPGAPLEQTCDTHYACAQLSGAVGSSPPTLPQVDPATTPRTVLSLDGASQPVRLAFRSRAPPA